MLWICFCFLLSTTIAKKRSEFVCDIKLNRYSLRFAFFCFLPIIISAAFREDFGDSNAYRYEYIYNAPETVLGLNGYISLHRKDTFFYAFTALLKILFNNQVWLYFLLIALVQGIFLLYIYRKYSDEYVFSIFLFIASTDYLSWMFNGMRQFLAVSLIFAATALILNKKYIKSIIVVLFASLLHQSALIMLPFIFVVNKKAWNKYTIAIIATVVLIVNFSGTFTSILDVALADTQYADKVDNWIAGNDDGTNIIRVLVYAVPTILALFMRKKIAEENNALLNLCVNMSIISTSIYAISAVTSGIIIGRLPIYFSLYNYILLPWELNHLFSSKSRYLAYFLVFVLYSVFYVYQVQNTWGYQIL